MKQYYIVEHPSRGVVIKKLPGDKFKCCYSIVRTGGMHFSLEEAQEVAAKIKRSYVLVVTTWPTFTIKHLNGRAA